MVEDKVFNAFKYQIWQQFITHLKEIVPSSVCFKQPNNLQERQNETIKLANFHVLICITETCSYLEKIEFKNKAKETDNPNPDTPDTKPQYKHNFQQLCNNIFKKSYVDFPKQDSET